MPSSFTNLSAPLGARNVSGVMSAGRFEDFACIKPLSRSRRIVTMFIGCGLRERIDAGTVDSYPVHPKGKHHFSPSRSDVGVSDVRVSVAPSRKTGDSFYDSWRFTNSHRRDSAGRGLLGREYACDYLQAKITRDNRVH